MESDELHNLMAKRMTQLSPKHVNLFRWWMKQGDQLKGPTLFAHIEEFFTEDGVEMVRTKAMKQGLYFIDYAPITVNRETRGVFHVSSEFYTGTIRFNHDIVASGSGDSTES